MIAIVQRVCRASVSVQGQSVARITTGLAILAAVERGDGEAQAHWMATKLAFLRIFPDAEGQKPWDLDVRQVGGAILLISNFTVAAACSHGRRPDLEPAAGTQDAETLFELLGKLLRDEGLEVATGRFGANMQVELTNDGPATFILQTPR